jgi:hypothetical protein
MKTKPAKFLMAMLIGFSSMTFVSTAALAGEHEHEHEHENDSTASTSCTGQWVTACNVKVFKTTCTGSTFSSETKSDENDDDDHHQSEHDRDQRDSHGKNDRERNDDSHKDHADRSQDSDVNARKTTICHRMGGEEHSLLVANDGYASGHSKHTLDTIGRCADFDKDKSDDDAKEEKDKDHKSSLSDAGYSMGLTTTQIACLKGSPDSTFTIGGKTYRGAGLNSSKVTFNLPSTGPSQGPSRGGARTLR